MKRLSYFMAVAMMLTVGCQKEEIKNNEVIENTGYTRTLTVGVADEADTRVGFDESNAFYWHEGDKIGVQTADGFKEMTLNEGYDHKVSGVFGGDFDGEMGEYVVYPYDEGHKVNGETLTYVLPATYEYESIADDANSFNAPMLGKIADDKATLNHLASFFKIIVENLPEGEGMTFTFTADKRITGAFAVDFSGEYPEINTEEADGKTVTITFSNTEDGADGYFYIPAPLGTYGSITVEVKDAAAEKTLVTKTWQNQTVRRKTPKRGTVPVGFVAEINGKRYETLQAAFDEVKDGETIELAGNVTVTEPAYGQNALNFNRAVSCIIDLKGYTLSADTGNSVLRFNITDSGAASDVTLNLRNGKVVAGSNTWCAVMACGIDADKKAILKLDNVTVEGSKAGDLAIKAWGNSIIEADDVTINATNGSGGFYALGGEIILDNCVVSQKGLHAAPYLSMAFAVSNGGKMTVNSGNYRTEPTAVSEGNDQGSSHGSWCGGVMNSGGTLIINGGTFSNDNFGENSLAANARGCIFADTGAEVEINGGTFNALKSIIDYQNNLGDASKNPVVTIKGGTFSSDPTTAWLAEGYMAVKNGEYYQVIEAQPFSKLVENVVNGNGTYEGNGERYIIEPTSGDSRNNDAPETVPDRLQKYSNPEVYYAQYQRFENLINVSISNVKVDFIPEAITVTDAWNTSGATTTVENVNGELQFMNSGTVTLNECYFNTVSVSPIKATELSVTSCEFNDLKAYAIKDIAAVSVSINDNTFTNCNGGFWFNAAPEAIIVKRNKFIDVGRRGAIQFSSNGDYSESTIDITDNEVTGGAFLWQLNTTLTENVLSEILEKNTYDTPYVSGSITHNN